MSLRVLEPGLYSTIVDAGRPRTRELGVPVGGPADRFAWEIGNALVGNPPGTTSLEITLTGPTLVATARVGAIVFGAPFSLGSGRQKLVANRTFTLEPGEELHVGGTPFNARAYICVSGGFQSPLILGSRCALGPIQRGDELVCAESAVRSRFIRADFADLEMLTINQAFFKSHHPRVLPGPESSWFDIGVSNFGEGTPWETFTVRPQSNRMGIRLEGHPLPFPDREMTSGPVAPGTLQVTRDGQIIILGVDGQTIGGYPRFGHVISADLDVVGQLRPGDRVSFKSVTLADATAALHARQALLDQWLCRLQLATSMF
jgi:5-oxoprolinase (ATP-hydrolysing) subunit C